MNFENFVQKVDAHMHKNSLTSKKSGKPKAAYELRCTWYEPFGAKFTFRSDNEFKKLQENSKIKPKTELQALQIKFATIRDKAIKATIYDNTEGYPGTILFMWGEGKPLVDKLDW